MIENEKKPTNTSDNDGLAFRFRLAFGLVFRRIQKVLNQLYDYRHHVDTHTCVHIDNLTIHSKHNDFGGDDWIYVPAPFTILNVSSWGLPEDLSNYVFIDFGSGKGRVLFWASNYNFKKIIGVEFATELDETAKNNISRFRSSNQKCFDIQSENVDATTFPIPAENCVMFFYNPFEEDVVKAVMKNVADSFSKQPRDVYIVYGNPKYPGPIDRLSFMEKARTKHSCFSDILRKLLPNSEPHDFIVYRSRQPDRTG